MNTIQNYKCPCCGDSLIFSSMAQGLHCESCGNDFSLDIMRQVSDAGQEVKRGSKFDWDHYAPRSYEQDEGINLAAYSCPSCGAEISGDNSLGATVCPYCGNATIIKGQFEGALRPDYLIPFKLDKKAAVKAFEADFAKAPFLPDEFRNKKKIEEMSGIYIPFWMFDCDSDASIIYRAQRI